MVDRLRVYHPPVRCVFYPRGTHLTPESASQCHPYTRLPSVAPDSLGLSEDASTNDTLPCKLLRGPEPPLLLFQLPQYPPDEMCTFTMVVEITNRDGKWVGEGEAS